MNLKLRFSLIFSCLFSALLAVVMLTVYFLFAKYRQDEFVDRLAEKAETTIKLLIQVKEVDYKMQKIIDSNSVTRLYNEKVLIFNQKQHIIYNSTNDSTAIDWTHPELARVAANNRILKTDKQHDVLGLLFNLNRKVYYVLISARDTYGYRKLNYLKYLLLGAFLAGTAAVWLISFSLSKKSLEPLDIFNRQIQEITDSNLNIRLFKGKREDEINALSDSFNQMMDRIDQAYQQQKEFTGNASHELRTPVARIAAQAENLLHADDISSTVKAQLKSMADGIFQVSEIISSLVALTQINNYKQSALFDKVRLDEIIFDVSDTMAGLYPECKIRFEVENDTVQDIDMEIPGDETPLKIVFLNLFKNACLYSDNQVIHCLVKQHSNTIQVIIQNTGETPKLEDTNVLFNTFYRGSNTGNKAGSGIGLSIVRRILQYHHATVQFIIPESSVNQLVASFQQR